MKYTINEQAADLLDENYELGESADYTVRTLINDLKKFPPDMQVRVGEEYNSESMSRIIKVEYNKYNDNVQLVID